MNEIEINKVRFQRINDLRKLGGRMGFVNRSLAQFLLGVCRQRIDQLISQGRLESCGINGSRLLYLRSVVEFAKASRRQKRGKISLRTSSKGRCKVRRSDALQTIQ